MDLCAWIEIRPVKNVMIMASDITAQMITLPNTTQLIQLENVLKDGRDLFSYLIKLQALIKSFLCKFMKTVLVGFYFLIKLEEK